MKRAKFAMLAVVVALILVGAGYAAWTQVFTINSTVSTGELFVQVVNTENNYEVLDAEGNVISEGGLNTGNDYLDLKVSSASTGEGTSRETLTELTFNLSKMYPGVRETSKISFKNLGTLKTVTTYKDAAVSPAAGNALWENLVIRVNGAAVNNGSSAGDKLNNFAEAVRSAIGNLEPNELKTVTIEIELPYESENNTENLSVKWTVPLTFTQYNIQAEE